MWQRTRQVVAVGSSTFALGLGAGIGVPVGTASAAEPGAVAALSGARCSSGARTLAPHGSVVYPETGDGGYTSLHTDVYLRFDAPRGVLLPGTRVALVERAGATCLGDFSLDFERHAPANLPGGPDLRVDSITVNGRPATYQFVRPTYPGDPHGADDPDPRAHQISQDNPVGGPRHNPLPPACSPSLASGSLALRHSQDGDPCPPTKLVVRPDRPIPAGARFTVQVSYHGRPGVHHDGDGSREGWFHVKGGSAGYTEPIGTQAWMPLNNHPTAKPTYDFWITTNPGKTAIANGRLAGKRTRPAGAQFPEGSVTWHWHAPFAIANYLVLSMVGDYNLSSRVGPDGRRYYLAQDRHIPPARRLANRKVMRMLPAITAFEERYNGPFPFPTDGVTATTPHFTNAEEMAAMIVFTNRRVGLSTLYHENMHQWWGDAVSESAYEYTFFKEGLATLSEYLWHASTAQQAVGGPETLAGRRAFERSLAARFDRVYARANSFWTRAPSDPASYTLFDGAPTYTRPGVTYIALRAILGGQRFIATLKHIQRAHGGSSISERQVEAAFHRFMPVRSVACQTRLDRFFRQWFDTGYQPGGGEHRPLITGPGLDGRGFYYGACHR